MAGVALGRDAFHGLPDMKRERVELPSRGGYVLVREMCADEILEFSDRMKEGTRGASAWLLARSVVDDAGSRLFGDDEAELLASSLNREEFMAVQGKLLELNGLGEEMEKK